MILTSIHDQHESKQKQPVHRSKRLVVVFAAISMLSCTSTIALGALLGAQLLPLVVLSIVTALVCAVVSFAVLRDGLVEHLPDHERFDLLQKFDESPEGLERTR